MCFCRQARQAYNMDEFAAYQAAAYSIRDRLVDRWNATQQVCCP